MIEIEAELDKKESETKTQQFLLLKGDYYSLNFYGYFLDEEDEDLSPYFKGQKSKELEWKIEIRKNYIDWNEN